MRICRQIGLICERLEHRAGSRIVLAQRGQTKNELHGADHADRGVLRAVDMFATHVRRNHQSDGAVRIHVVWSVLGIVLNDEDGSFGPQR